MKSVATMVDWTAGMKPSVRANGVKAIGLTPTSATTIATINASANRRSRRVAGAKTADLARKHAISEATLYNWKARYGGMEVSEAKRLKALEDENAKLKKLLAEQMLDVAAMRELLSKKW